MELSKFIQLSLEVGEFIPAAKKYKAVLHVAGKDWLPEKKETISISIPRVTNKKVTATIENCTLKSCSLSINYPMRGLSRQVAMVDWPYHPKRMIQIPIEAVISPLGDKKYVYIEKNGRAQKREISFINALNFFSLVDKNIQASERLIMTSIDRLIDGQAVEVLND